MADERPMAEVIAALRELDGQRLTHRHVASCYSSDPGAVACPTAAFNTLMFTNGPEILALAEKGLEAERAYPTAKMSCHCRTHDHFASATPEEGDDR